MGIRRSGVPSYSETRRTFTGNSYGYRSADSERSLSSVQYKIQPDRTDDYCMTRIKEVKFEKEAGG